jgi:hypothetical protein
MSARTLQRIDEQRLEDDLPYRFNYLAEFMGFDGDDVEAIHAAAAQVAPLVPLLVDAVYDKLFRYDSTKRHFLRRNFGYQGDLPTDLDSLTQEHDQIEFRKQHLANYLTRLVTADYDAKTVGYLDTVGKIHTPKAGSEAINVPLVQMNALMGFVSDALLSSVMELDIDAEAKIRTLRAFNKLLWLQNDLIVRHYAA